jgi:hypothetical protein
VISRGQRTQEELKAIEALEELSRQKSVDVVAPFTTTIQAEELASEPETNMPFCPTGGDPLQPDGQFTTLDSDVETPPVSSVPSSLRLLSQGNCHRYMLFMSRLQYVSSGKRKVGEVEASTPDSGREKKKARDESVPTEDDDLGYEHFSLFIAVLR